ncbi:hypothetical protein [Sulfurimonas sp.]|uniref:Spy/CpxP family protein refolding chaperone n=1 Tax=Sulfurimonas sp. TaxID=2022749 RepID=UPI0025E48A1F|nr:hypothetical protein [Sulfurimonas sp.]
MIKLKILTLLCSLFLSFSLYGDGNYKHEHEEKKHHIYKNLEYLNLGKNQYKEMREILLEYKKDYEKFNKKREKREKKLQELMREDEFSKEKYEEIVKEIQKDATTLELKTLKRIHSILSPSQRESFSYYLREWRVE